MHEVILSAFSDELIKIAAFQKLGGFTDLLREGWHGTPGNEATWFGQGRHITPGMGPWARRFEELTSLGGATKALPVGAKSLTMLGTGLMAREALRPNDPSGQQRSRAERIGSLAGNTIGGLVGSALGNRIRPGLLGSMVGGTLGAVAGEKLTSAPFAAMRQRRAATQQQQAPQVPQPVQQGVPA